MTDQMQKWVDAAMRKLEERFARDILANGGGYDLDSPSLFLNGGCLGDLVRQPLQLEPLEVSIPLPPTPDGRVFARAEYYPLCPQFLALPGLSC